METNGQTLAQKMSRVEENMRYIRENLGKAEGPIFVELMGTAKSGKTTLLNSLKNLFESQGVPAEMKQETAEYNPIQDKDIEEYNIWMIMELMKNLSEDMSNKTPRVIVYDRSMIDRLPWIDFSVNDGSFPARDAEIFKTLYSTEFLGKYRPITYCFETSPELSVFRKGKEGRLVNRKNVALFNESMKRELGAIASNSSRMRLIQTDPYQGDLKGFITDTTLGITSDIKEMIKQRETEKKNKTKKEMPTSPDEDGR